METLWLLKVSCSARSAGPRSFKPLPLQSHWKVKAPMLVSAYTNAAVDNLAEGLAARGLQTLRFGVTSRIREDLDKLTLEYRQKNHHLAPQYDATVKAIVLLGDGELNKAEKGGSAYPCDRLRMLISIWQNTETSWKSGDMA